MIVADTNLVSYLLIEGELTDGARRVRELDADWRLPPLWRSEFLNVLASAVRAGVLDEQQALSVWWVASDLFLGHEVEPDGDSVLTLALERRISAFDAQFVALAEDLEVPLVTGDLGIVQQCPELAITIEDFAASRQGSTKPCVSVMA